MNPSTQQAVEWLLGQPEFTVRRDPVRSRVHIGEHTFTERNIEDALCAAHEALYIKPALRDDRTTLPDYGNEGVLHEHTD